MQLQARREMEDFYRFGAYRFTVEVEGVLAAAFASVSGLGLRVDTLEYRNGNDKRHSVEPVIGLTRYENLRLAHGVVGDYEMMDWILSVSAPELSPGQRMRRNLVITLLDGKGQDGPRWCVTGAVPVGYTLSDLDAQRGDVALESLQIACRGIVREAVSGR